MDIVNFPAMLSQFGLLDSNDIVIHDDYLIIGKKVNKKRNGSQYQEMPIPISSLLNSFQLPATDLYVDKNFGDDSTALPNRFDKPYKTINAAIAAAIPPCTIYVRQGIYEEGLIFLSSNVNIYFEPGAEVRNTVITDLGNDIRTGIYGYMDMTENSYMLLTGESDIKWEFNTVNTTFGFLICNPAVGKKLNINIHGKSVYTLGFFGYAATFRGNTSGIVIIDDYINSFSIFSTIQFRSGAERFRGNITIKCPKIYMSGNGVAKNVVMVSEGVEDDSVINIHGDLINLNSNLGQYNAGLHCRRGKVSLYGNINYEADGGIGVIVDGGFYTGAGYVKIYGDVITRRQTAVFASHKDVPLLIQGGFIKGGDGGIYGKAVVIIGASMPGLPGMPEVWTYFKDCHIMQTETNSEIVNLTGNIPSDHKILAYNTEFFHNKPTVLDYVVVSTSGPRAPGFVNCSSNINLGVGISDFFSPTGFTLVNNLTIPRF